MKNMKLFALLLVGLQLTMHAAQESKTQNKNSYQRLSAIMNPLFAHATSCAVTDADADKDLFIETLHIAIQERRALDDIRDPKFMNIMSCKDDDLAKEKIHLWLREWSKSTDKLGLTPLQRAAWNDHVEIVKMFIEARVDLNSKPQVDSTPLRLAAQSDNDEIVELLIAAQAYFLEDDALVLLHYAVRHENIKLRDRSIELGADLNHQNYCGKTLLHDAVLNRDKELLKRLIEANADLNIQDKSNCTPLHRAVVIGDRELVAMLIKAGADQNIKCFMIAKDGTTGKAMTAKEIAGRSNMRDLFAQSGAYKKSRSCCTVS